MRWRPDGKLKRSVFRDPSADSGAGTDAYAGYRGEGRVKRICLHEGFDRGARCRRRLGAVRRFGRTIRAAEVPTTTTTCRPKRSE